MTRNSIFNGLFGMVLLLVGSAAVGQCQLSVGWEPWPPYQFEAEDGSISGLDGDLMNAIMAEMPCEAEWMAATWKRQLERLQSGKLGAALGASYTPARAEWGRFSEPYRQAVNHLVVTPELDGQFDSLEAFLAAGHKLGVMKDYHYGDDVMATLANAAYSAQIEPTQASEANMLKLTSGRVDGILMDAFVAANLKHEMGVEDKVAAQAIAVSTDDIYALFSKASVDAATVERFNAVLAKLKADGTIQEIIGRYMQ
ncbi:MAG: transporter substrate-binding domain-containing protein [Xanthomonadales bacterium]|nr:transporter substrate-binding domain-containing protein [Xanthomonadales bacterium]